MSKETKKEVALIPCDMDKDLIKDITFTKKDYNCPEHEKPDVCYHAHLDCGSITILDRLTGFGHNVRDVETGFRSVGGLFWLVSGDFDIRRYEDLSVRSAIGLIKEMANTCIPNSKEIEDEK